jgi:hypothetical protein
MDPALSPAIAAAGFVRANFERIGDPLAASK